MSNQTDIALRVINAKTLRESYKELCKSKSEEWSLDDDILEDKLGASFLKWNINHVRRYLGIPLKVPRIGLDEFAVHVPESLVNEVRGFMDVASYSLGSMIQGKEIKRVFACFVLFSPIVAQFRGCIRLDPEGSLSSQASQGRCEFVYRFLDDVIVKVVEAKKDNVEQGMAHLLLMLQAAHLTNVSNNIKLKRLFGCISLGWAFILVVYTPSAPKQERFKMSETMNMDYDVDQPLADREAMVRRFAQVMMGVFLRAWTEALDQMNTEQRLRYTSRTIALDSLNEGEPNNTLVDKAVGRAKALYVRLGTESDDAKLVILYDKLNCLAKRFASNDLTGLEMEME